MSPALFELARRYVDARDRAVALRRKNHEESVKAHAGNGREDGPSGVAHHTSMEVIDAVAAWKQAAIALAEHVAEQLS